MRSGRLPTLALTLVWLRLTATAYGYGGWQSNTFVGALWEVLPAIAGGLLPLLVPFCIRYWWIDRAKPYRVAAALLFVFVDLACLQSLVTMGEPGPAHFAADVVGLAAVLLPCFLLLKLLFVSLRQKAGPAQ